MKLTPQSTADTADSSNLTPMKRMSPEDPTTIDFVQCFRSMFRSMLSFNFVQLWSMHALGSMRALYDGVLCFRSISFNAFVQFRSMLSPDFAQCYRSASDKYSEPNPMRLR